MTSPMWFANLPWADAVTVAFAFVVGTMLGSFLNVVVHRVPAGGSVVFGRSRCPRCHSPVRPGDNVPILSWLLLRGRCRDCAGPIAPRYPLVEAACGAVVAAVAAADLAAGASADAMLDGNDWRTPALIVFHAWLVTTLLAWGLLAAGGHAVGGRTVLIAVGIAAGGATMLSLSEGSRQQAFPWWSDGVARTAAPWLARLLGTGLAWAVGRRFGCGGTGESLGLAAVACGWKAVPLLTIVTLLVQACGRRNLLLERRNERDAEGPLAAVIPALSAAVAVVAAIAAGIGQGG